MIALRSIPAVVRIGFVACVLAGTGAAWAQTPAPSTPQERSDGRAEATPNAVTPPGGIARGVIPPPRSVDPEIVTKPPAHTGPTMPVIKPPGISR